GKHYILTEVIDSKVVQTGPMESRDGRTMILRFTTTHEEPGAKTIDHEISYDDGKTWRLFRRQYMEKVTDPA
ncbi:MAG: hypothetical protein V3R73_06615, partial [Sphingomonadales bacterium]